MNKKIKINIFADKQKKEDIPAIKPADKNTIKYETSQIDPNERKAKKNKLIKWIIALAIIGLFIGLMVWSCVPSYKYIKPYEATISNNDLKITTSNTDTTGYTIELDNDNIQSYYYVTGADFTTYTIISNTTTRGQIQFTMQVYVEKPINTDVVKNVQIGRSIIDVNDPNNTNFLSWVNRAVSNATTPSQSVDIWYIIMNLLPMILIIGIMIWSFSKIGKMGGGMGQGEDSIFGMGKSQAKIATSNVKFADVAGIEEEKAELAEIVDYLKNPEIYAAMGARTPRGVMLYGPPGTGKTLLAKAVAGEASVPFFQASGSSFEDMLVGVGAKRVRNLFAQAKKSAPSIIFIDEIDSVASKRGKSDMMGGGGLADQTINQLLAEMDGFNSRTGVVVMAATNRLDVLDDAILRPGRFDRHISVNLPDIKEREQILKIHARNKNISNKVKYEEVARRTPGFSGAQLENTLNEATLLAVRAKRNVITLEDIDEAIDRVIAGPSKKTRVITEEERIHIAYHEAGHALVGLHTPSGDVVEKITIIPRGQAAGYTLSTPFKQELAIQKKSDLLAIIRTTLGGRAAEQVTYGNDAISTGAANDLYKITNIVRSMVTQLGMSEVGMTQFIPSEGVMNPNSVKLYSDQTAVRIDKQIEDIIQKEYINAINIIKKNKKELDLIVEALIILETIVKSQIDYIHANLKLPKEALDRKNEIKQSKQNTIIEESKTKEENNKDSKTKKED